LADFNNFWQVTSGKNLTQVTVVDPPDFNTVTTLSCEMQKSLFGHLQQWIYTG